MLKILQARLQQYVSWELPDGQAGFRKVRGTRDQIANIHCIIEKAKKLKKRSASLTTPKPLTVWITANCGKFLKRWEYQTIWLPPEKSVYRSRSKLELDMQQQIGSKLRKKYIKAVYCHPVYLTSIQSTSWEMPSWMKHKLESRLLGEKKRNNFC